MIGSVRVEISGLGELERRYETVDGIASHCVAMHSKLSTERGNPEHQVAEQLPGVPAHRGRVGGDS
jgi:hypothetical protein